MKEGMYVIDDCACEGRSLGSSYSCPGEIWSQAVYDMSSCFQAWNAAASCTIQGSPWQEGGVDSAGTGSRQGALTLLELGVVFIVSTSQHSEAELRGNPAQPCSPVSPPPRFLHEPQA